MISLPYPPTYPIWTEKESALYCGPRTSVGLLADHIRPPIDLVVSLQEHSDSDRLEYEQQLKAHRISLHTFPLADLAVPSLVDVEKICTYLERQLETDSSIYLHCTAGQGRTGVVVGCFLLRRGLAEAAVLQRLVAFRGPSCPETPGQLAFIRDYASRSGTNKHTLIPNY